jgi:hypothetical protein
LSPPATSCETAGEAVDKRNAATNEKAALFMGTLPASYDWFRFYKVSSKREVRNRACASRQSFNSPLDLLIACGTN